MKKLCNKEGITLISLVVTIIVLFIIAGVMINATIGENGILKSTEAKQEQIEIKQLKEDLDIDKQQLTIKNNGKININDFQEYISDKYEISDVKEKNLYNSYIEIDNKYVFLIKQEDEENIDIIYQGIAQEMPPILDNIQIQEVGKDTIKIGIITKEFRRNTR